MQGKWQIEPMPTHRNPVMEHFVGKGDRLKKYVRVHGGYFAGALERKTIHQERWSAKGKGWSALARREMRLER